MPTERIVTVTRTDTCPIRVTAMQDAHVAIEGLDPFGCSFPGEDGPGLYAFDPDTAVALANALVEMARAARNN